VQDSQKRTTAEPPPTDYKPINPKAIVQIGASQGTCSEVSEGNDELMTDFRHMRNTPPENLRRNGPSQKTISEPTKFDRTGGIKKLELRVTHSPEIAKEIKR
jgi:hypothetical protein